MRRHLPEANRQAGGKAKVAITAQGDPVGDTLGRRRKSISECEKASAVHQDNKLPALLLRGSWCLGDLRRQGCKKAA